MISVLLSIKPEFARSILDGKKKFEFRKSIFKKQSIDTVYLYATTPVSRIVGTFKIGRIIQGEPKWLWDEVGELSGISYETFSAYFEYSEVGYAIEIKNLEPLANPLDPKEIVDSFVPPQSFKYVDRQFFASFSGKLQPRERDTKLVSL